MDAKRLDHHQVRRSGKAAKTPVGLAAGRAVDKAKRVCPCDARRPRRRFSLRVLCGPMEAPTL